MQQHNENDCLTCARLADEERAGWRQDLVGLLAIAIGVALVVLLECI